MKEPRRSVPKSVRRGKRARRRAFYRVLLLGGIANGLLALLIGLPFLRAPAETAAAAVFKYAAWFSGMMLWSLLIAGFSCLLYLLLRARPAAGAAAAALFALYQFYLFVDVRVYEHLRFHINHLAIEAMLTPGYWDSVRFETADVIVTAAAALLLLAGEGALIGLGYRSLLRGGLFSRLARPRRIAFCLGAAAAVLLAEKAAFGLADFYAYSPIIRLRKAFPLYQPVTFKKNLSRLTGRPPVEAGVRLSLEGSSLNYPLPGYRIHPLPRRLNVLIIVVESLRFDMLDEKTMPNLSRFSRGAVRLRNHYSGGNTSRFGGFSLLYGLYPTYWHQFLAERRGPVLLDHLADCGYAVKAFSSTSMQYPEFRQTAFSAFPDAVEDRMGPEKARDRDRVLVKRFREWLRELPADGAFYCFAFLDAPHAPYSFFEPEAVFTPYSEEISYARSDLREHRAEIFNRYRNSINCADRSIGEILSALEEGGRGDKTIVIVTGDHGQEFWEAGYFGHNSAYTDYQVRVPLVIRVPGMAPAEISRRTSHLDVVPTVLNLLGSENPPELYSNGKDIFGGEFDDFLVLGGWSDCCLLTPEHKIRFALEAYSAFGEDSLDRQDRPVSDRAALEKDKALYLLPALEGMRRFLK